MSGVTATGPSGFTSDAARGRRPSSEAGEPGARLVVSKTQGEYDPELHWLLGRDGDRVVFATAVPDLEDGFSLREAGPLLPVADAEYAAMAGALGAWHRAETYCPTCGSKTSVLAAGTARWCPSCESERFPRTDPAVIVAITDSLDRLLLAHQGAWATGRHSVLAGFVEAGESLEQAVHREVFEEAQLHVDEVTYFGSQPWPFPRSIMLGFLARAKTTEIQFDGVELVSGGWYSRADLQAAVAAGSVILPGEASIAYHLIRHWQEHPAS